MPRDPRAQRPPAERLGIAHRRPGRSAASPRPPRLPGAPVPGWPTSMRMTCGAPAGSAAWRALAAVITSMTRKAAPRRHDPFSGPSVAADRQSQPPRGWSAQQQLPHCRAEVGTADHVGPARSRHRPGLQPRWDVYRQRSVKNLAGHSPPMTCPVDTLAGCGALGTASATSASAAANAAAAWPEARPPRGTRGNRGYRQSGHHSSAGGTQDGEVARQIPPSPGAIRPVPNRLPIGERRKPPPGRRGPR